MTTAINQALECAKEAAGLRAELVKTPSQRFDDAMTQRDIPAMLALLRSGEVRNTDFLKTDLEDAVVAQGLKDKKPWFVALAADNLGHFCRRAKFTTLQSVFSAPGFQPKETIPIDDLAPRFTTPQLTKLVTIYAAHAPRMDAERYVHYATLLLGHGKAEAAASALKVGTKFFDPAAFAFECAQSAVNRIDILEADERQWLWQFARRIDSSAAIAGLADGAQRKLNGASRGASATMATAAYGWAKERGAVAKRIDDDHQLWTLARQSRAGFKLAMMWAVDSNDARGLNSLMRESARVVVMGRRNRDDAEFAFKSLWKHGVRLQKQEMAKVEPEVARFYNAFIEALEEPKESEQHRKARVTA